MMAIGIIPIPGTTKSSFKNGFDFEIDLSWFPIVSTGLSIIGVLTGALWIVEPAEKQTNWMIAKLLFIPIFFYRMLVWLIILIILHSFSIIPIICFVAMNCMVLIFIQERMDIDPVNHSLLSLVFPVHKLPSQEIDSKVSMKILLWMVLVGNSMLLLLHIIIYCLYYFNAYNPWNSSHSIKLLVPEDVYKSISPLVLTLFIAATLPLLLSHLLSFQRYFFERLVYCKIFKFYT